MRDKSYNSKVVPLFGIPMYMSECEVSSDEKKIFPDLKYKDNFDGAFKVSNDNQLHKHNHPVLRSLHEKIQNHLDHFVHEVLEVRSTIYPSILASWAVQVQPKGFSPSHLHYGNSLSGILYVDVPPDSGSITFHKEHTWCNLFHTSIEPPLEKQNQYTSNTFTVNPSAGTILLFPNHLKHNINTNKSQEYRYSIAFDVALQGDFSNTLHPNKHFRVDNESNSIR